MSRRHLPFLFIALLASAAGGADAPRQVKVSDLPAYRDELVSVRGTVRDVFPDERDANYIFLRLLTDDGPVFATALCKNPEQRAFVTGLVDAEISATGFCRPSNFKNLQPRRHLGYSISVIKAQGGRLTVLTPAPADPFRVPEIDETTELGPIQIQQLGKRRLRGKVLAVWGRGNLLVKTPSERFSHIELNAESLPTVGSFVEAVGFADTDAYRLNLTRAIWRPTAAWPTTDDVAQAVPAARVLDNRSVNTEMYGRLIELEGVVQTLPGDAKDGIVRIDSDGYAVPLDASACPAVLDGLTVGCRVKATGLCLLNIENYRSNNVFPQVRGFSLILRDPADLTVLARPPWWNSQRLGGLLVVILGVTIFLFIWNRSLRILAERRGRQLADEQIQRTGTELKVLERTRLSVDLHDALSQNLAGVTFALDAAKALTRDTGPVRRYLDIASKALLSCRTELRNCLWDLRNNALGNCSMDEAIRRSLIPIAGKAKTIIRFNVPREKLTDDMAHSVLRIVRELAANALRHGKASTIRIAGCLDGHLLRFTVHDDGTGFGPQPAPGPAEGHFGLQGIRERVRLFNGELTIDRDKASGAHVSVSLHLPEFDSPKESPR